MGIVHLEAARRMPKIKLALRQIKLRFWRIFKSQKEVSYLWKQSGECMGLNEPGAKVNISVCKQFVRRSQALMLVNINQFVKE